jgi:hypothetical protein
MYKQPINPEDFRNAFRHTAMQSHTIDRIHVEGNLDPGPFEDGSFHLKVTLGRKPMAWGAAHFELSALPGCGGILVSHNSWVGYEYRGTGIGSLMQDMKRWVAEQIEVRKLIATVVQGNNPEEQLLLKHGWTRGLPFWNPHTSNHVVEWEKILR